MALSFILFKEKSKARHIKVSQAVTYFSETYCHIYLIILLLLSRMLYFVFIIHTCLLSQELSQFYLFLCFHWVFMTETLTFTLFWNNNLSPLKCWDLHQKISPSLMTAQRFFLSNLPSTFRHYSQNAKNLLICFHYAWLALILKVQHYSQQSDFILSISTSFSTTRH